MYGYKYNIYAINNFIYKKYKQKARRYYSTKFQFIAAIKKIQYPGIKLMKHTNLYSENRKMLLKNQKKTEFRKCNIKFTIYLIKDKFK